MTAHVETSDEEEEGRENNGKMGMVYHFYFSSDNRDRGSSHGEIIKEHGRNDAGQASHHDAGFITRASLDLVGRYVRVGWVTTRGRRADELQPMLGSFVALIGRAHVPYVGLEWISATTDAHLGEVAERIFRLGHACEDVVSGSPVDE